MSALVVWMNGEFVGTWSVGRTGNHRLDYAPSWRGSARSRPLSLSLTTTTTSATSILAHCCAHIPSRIDQPSLAGLRKMPTQG